MCDIYKNTLTTSDIDSDILNIANHDFESVSAKTEDSLLSSKSSSETTSISKSDDSCCGKKCGSVCGIISGSLLSITGILFLIWTPFHILMTSRLDMMPGLPPYDWWKDPPQEVRLRAFIFNITNAQEFISGAHPRMKVEQIGPIVYLERLTHKNVYFNDNGTLSYTVNRTAIYLPEENNINLNETIIIPNFAVLGMASHLSDASYFMKLGFNMVLRGYKSPIFVKTTIYNYLWNFTDPILNFAQTIEPGRVPDLNVGMLSMIYRDFEDNATVYIGNKNGNSKFFQLNNFDGSEYLPGHGSACKDLVTMSTEGAHYPQFITKNMTLRYWRKTMCKVITLNYEREKYMDKYSLLAYKFTKRKDEYKRKKDLEADCYKGDPVLPEGLIDISKCYMGINMAASYPHFLYAGETVKNYVDGLKPDVALHESFTYVEPTTGVPVESIARSQSNLIVKDTSSFSTDLQKFSNMAVPMFWLEYNQVGLPDYVKYLLIFTVNIVPNYQYFFISFLLILGSYLQIKFFKKIRENRSYNYENNSNLSFETEAFLSHK